MTGAPRCAKFHVHSKASKPPLKASHEQEITNAEHIFAPTFIRKSKHSAPGKIDGILLIWEMISMLT
jgi:hypothetical protein